MVERTDNNSKQDPPVKTSSMQSAKTCRVRMFFFGAFLFAVLALLWAHRIPLQYNRIPSQYNIPPQYSGTAIFERRKPPVSAEASLPRSETFSIREKILRHDLASRDAVEEAIEQLGLTKIMERDRGNLTSKGLRAKQELIKQFSKRITIKWEASSDQIDLISVSFTHSDPELAEKMPNSLVANYINRVSMQAVENLTNSKEFLERQVRTCNDLLNGLSRERIRFEEENKGVIPDSPSTLHENIFQINADLDAVRLRHQVAIQELKSLQGLEQSLTGSAGDPNKPREIFMGPNPELARLKAELHFAKDILDDILTVTQTVGATTEKNPIVQMLRLKITRLEVRIQQTEPMVATNQVYGRIVDNTALAIQLLRTKATVEGTQGEIKRLENRLKAYESMLRNFGPIRQKYLEDTKKIEGKQAELTRWQEMLQSVKTSLAAEVAKRRTHLNVVQAAWKPLQPQSPPHMEPLRPQSPSLAKIFLITLCGALVVGGILTVLPLRFRLPGRIIIIALIVILLLAVGFLATCITMKLNHPDQYQEWRASPLDI